MSGLPDLAALRERLLGFKLEGGPVIVPSHERVIGHRALACDATDGDYLHPVWAILLGLRGMDMSFDDLFELAGATVEEGIYFGEACVDLQCDLKAGTTYQVTGRITDLVRRQGKTVGTFDVVTFELDLLGPDGMPAATATNSFLFVRKSSS